jgi:hypothetical protein
VKRPAVELHGEPLCTPQEVDLVGADLGVDLGLGKARVADEGEEAFLQLGAGEGRIGVEEPAEGGDAGATGVAVEEGDKGG